MDFGLRNNKSNLLEPQTIPPLNLIAPIGISSVHVHSSPHKTLQFLHWTYQMHIEVCSVKRLLQKHIIIMLLYTTTCICQDTYYIIAKS